MGSCASILLRWEAACGLIAPCRAALLRAVVCLPVPSHALVRWRGLFRAVIVGRHLIAASRRGAVVHHACLGGECRCGLARCVVVLVVETRPAEQPDGSHSGVAVPSGVVPDVERPGARAPLAVGQQCGFGAGALAMYRPPCLPSV
jgi:hypothetical protein